MNRLYKTYLMWRYLAQQAIKGDFGLRIRFKDVNVNVTSPDVYHSDEVRANILVQDASASVSFKPDYDDTQISTSIIINNELENNYIFTLRDGYMFSSSIDVEGDAELSAYIEDRVPKSKMFKASIKTENALFSAGLYVEEIHPLIIFSLEHANQFNSVTTRSISEDVHVHSLAETEMNSCVDSWQSDDAPFEVEIQDVDIPSKVMAYTSNVVNALIKGINIDTSSRFTFYTPTELSTSIQYFYDLDFVAELKIQQSEIILLEHPTILLESSETTSTLSIDNIVDDFNPKVEVEDVTSKQYFDLPDAQQMNLSVSNDTDILTTKVDLNTRVTQINAECDIEECDIKSYFIYSTYAKLNEYWDNTYTLNSMGNSTMNSLTYHEYSYN